MYELFLTTAVADGDLEMSCAVLQGYTWMRARSSIERVQFHAGPRQPNPKGLPVTRLFQRPNNNPAAGPNNNFTIPIPWQALSKEFSRSSVSTPPRHLVWSCLFEPPRVASPMHPNGPLEVRHVRWGATIIELVEPHPTRYAP